MTLSKIIRAALSCGLLVPCLLATSLAGWGQRLNIGWGPGYHAGDYRGVRYGSAWTDYRPPGAPVRAPQCDCPRCRSAAEAPQEPTPAPVDSPPTFESMPTPDDATSAEPSTQEELSPADRWPEELPPREESAPSPAQDEESPEPRDSGDDVLDLIEPLFRDR